MKLLEGKVAIVTGAGRPKGMGRASALKLAAQSGCRSPCRTRRDGAAAPLH